MTVIDVFTVMGFGFALCVAIIVIFRLIEEIEFEIKRRKSKKLEAKCTCQTCSYYSNVFHRCRLITLNTEALEKYHCEYNYNKFSCGFSKPWEVE